MKFTIHFPFPSEWRKEFILFLLVFLTNKHSDFTCIYLFIDKFLSFIYTQKTKKSKLSSHRFILYWPIIKIDMENEKKNLPIVYLPERESYDKECLIFTQVSNQRSVYLSQCTLSCSLRNCYFFHISFVSPRIQQKNTNKKINTFPC